MTEGRVLILSALICLLLIAAAILIFVALQGGKPILKKGPAGPSGPTGGNGSMGPTGLMGDIGPTGSGGSSSTSILAYGMATSSTGAFVANKSLFRFSEGGMIYPHANLTPPTPNFTLFEFLQTGIYSYDYNVIAISTSTGPLSVNLVLNGQTVTGSVNTSPPATTGMYVQITGHGLWQFNGGDICGLQNDSENVFSSTGGPPVNNVYLAFNLIDPLVSS